MAISQKQHQALGVTICYAPGDKDEARNLYEQTRVVGITPWFGGVDLKAGQDRHEEIRRQIKQADVALIVLSRQAVEKDGSFWRELNQVLDVAEERRDGSIFVIPVRIEECEIPERLVHLQEVDWFEQPEGFDRLMKALVACGVNFGIEVRPREVLPLEEKWRPTVRSMQEVFPYKGLFVFQKEDAPFFFGREIFIKQLSTVVRQKPLVAVVGASGSGKSSVVFAGVIPRLQQEKSWQDKNFRPGTQPFRALAVELMDLLEEKLDEFDRLEKLNKWEEGLRKGSVNLPQIIARFWEKQPGTNVLLVADQFEELYTLCKEEEREAFLNFLLTAVQPSFSGPHKEMFRLVLTLRADFFSYALSYRPFADALQLAQQNLGPMNEQELREAIVRPAELLGVQIEDGLSERILEAVKQAPGNLPLLEFALGQLWERRVKLVDGRIKLTHMAYEEIGGVTQAIARYAEEQFEQLSKTEQEQAQQIFIQLVQPGMGTEDTRRVAMRPEIGEKNWALVKRMADTRLIVSARNTSSQQETVEVVHEALINNWSRLQEWMKMDRAFRTWQEQLRTTLHQWKDHEHNEDYLLRGALLAEAEGWLQKREAELSQSEKSFIHSSISLQQAELLVLQGEKVLFNQFGWRFNLLLVITVIFSSLLAGLIFTFLIQQIQRTLYVESEARLARQTTQVQRTIQNPCLSPSQRCNVTLDYYRSQLVVFATVLDTRILVIDEHGLVLVDTISTPGDSIENKTLSDYSMVPEDNKPHVGARKVNNTNYIYYAIVGPKVQDEIGQDNQAKEASQANVISSTTVPTLTSSTPIPNNTQPPTFKQTLNKPTLKTDILIALPQSELVYDWNSLMLPITGATILLVIINLLIGRLILKPLRHLIYQRLLKVN